MRVKGGIPDLLRFPSKQIRLLACISFLDMSARVLFITVGLVYFMVGVGMSAGHIGAVLTGSGAFAVLVGVPLSQLVERFGSRRVLTLASLGQGMGTVFYIFVEDLFSYALVTVWLMLCVRTGYAAKGAIMGVVLVDEDRTTNRSKIASLSNAAAGFAAAFGSWVLHLDDERAYRGAFVCTAVLFIVSAIVSTRLPNVEASRVAGGPPPEKAGASRLTVLRDRPYIALTVIDGLFTLQVGLLEIAPLWIAEHTGAPRWMGGVLSVLNCTVVVLFQVRVGKRVTSPWTAAIVNRRAGALLCVSCVLFGMAGEQAWIAVVVLLAAALVFVVAEMLHAAAGWELSFGLAPTGKHSQYQAMYGSGTSLGATVAPVVATVLVLEKGTAGWIGIGLLFLLSGFATPWATRWALNTPPRARTPCAGPPGSAVTTAGGRGAPQGSDGRVDAGQD